MTNSLIFNSGTQASLKVIPADGGALWWAGKELMPAKSLSDFVGKNEKTKLVVKLQKKGAGPPGREAPISEEEKKKMMLHSYRRQEELKVNYLFLLTLNKPELFTENFVSSAALSQPCRILILLFFVSSVYF